MTTTSTPSSPLPTSAIITTYTGRRVDLLNPKTSDFCIEDVAHALSLTNRYVGHTAVPYSVAQHSVLVMKRVARIVAERALELAALLHDGPEAYLGDVSHPLKQCLPDYKAIEERFTEVFNAAFKLPPLPWPEIHTVDREMWEYERSYLFRGYEIAAAFAWTAAAAKREFLLQYHIRT
jgi:uncharacterized protein